MALGVGKSRLCALPAPSKQLRRRWQDLLELALPPSIPMQTVQAASGVHGRQATTEFGHNVYNEATHFESVSSRATKASALATPKEIDDEFMKRVK